MFTYLLVGYMLIGSMIALIIAVHDYRLGHLKPALVLLGAVAWPLVLFSLALYSRTELNVLYLRELRKLEEKKRQRHFRQTQQKRNRQK